MTKEETLENEVMKVYEGEEIRWMQMNLWGGKREGVTAANRGRESGIDRL